MEFSKDLNAASASPLILTILQESPSYGYSIIRQVETVSNGLLKWEEGMLYPILHRMEKLEWIESFWDQSNVGRRRKYYRLLGEGRRALENLQYQWEQMDSILRAAWSGNASFEAAQPDTGQVIDEDDGELPVSLL